MRTYKQQLSFGIQVLVMMGSCYAMGHIVTAFVTESPALVALSLRIPLLADSVAMLSCEAWMYVRNAPHCRHIFLLTIYVTDSLARYQAAHLVSSVTHAQVDALFNALHMPLVQPSHFRVTCFLHFQNQIHRRIKGAFHEVPIFAWACRCS